MGLLTKSETNFFFFFWGWMVMVFRNKLTSFSSILIVHVLDDKDQKLYLYSSWMLSSIYLLAPDRRSSIEDCKWAWYLSFWMISSPSLWRAQQTVTKTGIINHNFHDNYKHTSNFAYSLKVRAVIEQITVSRSL